MPVGNKNKLSKVYKIKSIEVKIKMASRIVLKLCSSCRPMDLLL